MPSIRWSKLWYYYTIYQIRFQARQPGCLFLSELKKKMAFMVIRRRNSWILTNWTEEMQEYAKYIARLILPTFWGVSLRENVCLYPELLPRNRRKFWRASTRRLSWISSDCFESFSLLSNVVTEGVITTRSNRMKFRLREGKLVAVRLLQSGPPRQSWPTGLQKNNNTFLENWLWANQQLVNESRIQ